MFFTKSSSSFMSNYPKMSQKFKVINACYMNAIWVATQRKEPYVGKIKIEFCRACPRGYSSGHFGTKIMYLAQLWTELLRILSIQTCIMKN